MFVFIIKTEITNPNSQITNNIQKTIIKCQNNSILNLEIEIYLKFVF